MVKIIRSNYSFFYVFLLWLAIGLITNILFSQQNITLFINGFNSEFTDVLFKYYTDAGNGWFYSLFAFSLLFISFRYALVATLAGISVSAIVQIMKQVVFPDDRRPWAVMHDNKHLHLVKDFIPYDNNSFPSGHTTTAFCMFALMAFFVKNKKAGYLFFILALFVAWSRIYLIQHFFIDTYIGSIIGTALALGFYSYFCPVGRVNNTWLDKSLLRLKG